MVNTIFINQNYFLLDQSLLDEEPTCTVTKMTKECPHKKDTLSLFCNCDIDISESEFQKELNIRDMAKTTVFVKQKFERDPSYTYTVSIGLKGMEKKHYMQVGAKVNHVLLCKFNGAIRMGRIPITFKDVNCKKLQNIFLLLNQKQVKKKMKCFLRGAPI